MTYGYFDDPTQLKPTYDPELEVDCPICNQPLNYPTRQVKTISLMAEGDSRSYFYRTHKTCYENLSPQEVTNLDSIIIDFVALRKDDIIL